MSVQNLSELIRFIQFVPYRLRRILRYLTRTAAPRFKSSAAEIFDLLHGIDTEKTVKVYKLDAVTRSYIHSHGYESYCPNRLADILASLPIRRERYEFIDIGCGKGRALVVAHELGFQCVTGVEISPTLCQIAEQNLATCGVNGRVVCQDAIRFPLPAGPTVIYFYNPFGARIMKRLAKKIERKLQNSPNDLWIVYVSPGCRKIFDRSKRLSVDRNVANAAIYRTAFRNESRLRQA